MSFKYVEILKDWQKHKSLTIYFVGKAVGKQVVSCIVGMRTKAVTPVKGNFANLIKLNMYLPSDHFKRFTLKIHLQKYEIKNVEGFLLYHSLLW